jgi:hypothetical protein
VIFCNVRMLTEMLFEVACGGPKRSCWLAPRRNALGEIVYRREDVDAILTGTAYTRLWAECALQRTNGTDCFLGRGLLCLFLVAERKATFLVLPELHPRNAVSIFWSGHPAGETGSF